MLGSNNISVSNLVKTRNHPCFSGSCQNARMHIPVAPACNITCNYCNRKYDCVNESRPGVTSELLTPQEAAEKFSVAYEKLGNLKVVGIAGPGDALANFENTRASIKLIKQRNPYITFCLSTNGLMLPYYANEIIRLGVTHVTVTINAIDPEIGALIYKEINYMGKKLTGTAAAEILIRNQLEGLTYLVMNGVVCKVNIVMIKGINDKHIEAVVERVKECGAFITNIMPLIPAKGSGFENMPLTSNKELNELRKKCGVIMEQMYHCKQCRADAIGTLEKDCSSEFRTKKMDEDSDNEKLEEKNYTFAIASKSGLHVDNHFGKVDELYIYSYKNTNIDFVEKRPIKKYCSGEEHCDDEESHLKGIMNTIKDCNGLIVMRIGYKPSKFMKEHNIKIFETCDTIPFAIKGAVEEIKKMGANLV